LYLFPIDADDHYGVDTPEVQTPAVRFRATGEKYVAVEGRWKCENTWSTKCGDETFFFPGQKTLIWKWKDSRSARISKRGTPRSGLVLVDLENTCFAVFLGEYHGVVKWHRQLSVQQEKAALLVLCYRLERRKRDDAVNVKKLDDREVGGLKKDVG